MADFDIHMLANFIHQVINPLNGVIGTIDNLIDGTTRADKREQRLRAVRAQLEHSIEMIRNLGYLSSIASGNVKSTRKIDVVVPQITIEAAQFFQEPGYSRGIKIELSNPEAQYVVIGEPHLLRQVFMNIFENGVKYGHPNSKITVVSRVQKTTGRLLVEITSKGIGFKSGDRERIFELGYRTEEAQQRIASGSGLGLFICRHIMEQAFNGEITAEHHAREQSTKFTLKFPSFRFEGNAVPPNYQRP